MTQVVLDTNVLISALFWRGIPNRIWLATRTGICTCVTSPPLMTELRDVLTRAKGPFRLTMEEYQRVAHQIRRHSTIVRPTSRLSIVADEADNRVLECAVAGRCEYVVTGDSDLLDLATHQGIKIVPPSVFWSYLAGLPRPIRRRKRPRR